MDEPVPAAPAAEPSALSRYDRGRMIGAGSVAEVFEALDHKSVRRVALKMAKASVTVTPEAREKAEREARAVAALNHPNIVGLFEAGEDQGRPFLIMERTDGFPLAPNTVEPETALEVVEKAARAADAAHTIGIVHGDLKPGNILMTRNGEPKLSDFGLVHWRPAPAVTAFAAPEQLNGGTATPRTDVYALGAILYEYIAGKAPFAAATPEELKAQILSAAPASPREANPGVNKDLETVILKCLEKDPDFRFATALDLAEELARLKRHMPIRTRRLTAAKRIQHKVVRHKVAVIVGIVLAAGAVAGGVVVRETLRREAAAKAEREYREGVDAGTAAIAKADDLAHQAGADPAELRALAAAALVKLETAAGHRPSDAAVQRLLGRAREIEGRDDLAEAAFRRALELEPKAVPLKFDLARLLARRSFLERQLISNARMGDLGDPWRNETRKLLDEVVERAAELESDLLRDLAAVQHPLTKGERDAARTAALAKIGSWRGRRGEEEFQFLLAQVTEGQLKVDSLNRVIELRPVDAVALYYRGGVETGLKQWAEAVADFRAALKVHPDMDAPAVGLAVVLETQKDLEGAIAELKHCLEVHPDFVLGRGVRGRLLSELRKLPEAQADLDHALKIRPDFRLALAYRGVVHNLSEQYQRAYADLTRALEGSKNDAPSDLAFMRLHRGTVLVHLKRFDEGLHDLREAVKLDEGNPTPHMIRSWALGSQPDPDYRGALTELDEALRLAPPDWPNRAWATQQREYLVGRLEKKN